MHDDTVTTSWKRLTDKVNTLGGDGVDDTVAEPPVAGRRTHRDGEEVQQAAKLATWEDDGGATGGTARTQETAMDWTLVEADWQQFRGEVHANWGKLTSGQLDMIAGGRALLATKIREAYGVTDEEAERQIKSFEARNQHPRPVSFR